MLTGLDGSRIEAIRMGSSRINGLDCILVKTEGVNFGEEERRDSDSVRETEWHKEHQKWYEWESKGKRPTTKVAQTDRVRTSVGPVYFFFFLNVTIWVYLFWVRKICTTKLYPQ